MIRILVVSLSSAFLLSACASGAFKARQEQREKLASSSGMFCEFISGDVHPDLDVELNMAMARRCDSSRPFTITNYKNSSNQQGVVYCCAMAGSSRSYSTAAPTAPTAAKLPVKAKPAPAPVKDDSGEEVIPAE
ncbi:MAG: hypothetical protein ACM3MG_09850 [Bacillota bacterium]